MILVVGMLGEGSMGFVSLGDDHVGNSVHTTAESARGGEPFSDEAAAQGNWGWPPTTPERPHVSGGYASSWR